MTKIELYPELRKPPWLKEGVEVKCAGEGHVSRVTFIPDLPPPSEE